MAYVNNGQFRAKQLEVTIDGETSIFDIKDEFTWDAVTYPKILTDTAFAQLPLVDSGTPERGYTARLAAFYEYVEDQLDLTEGDLENYGYDITELPNGHTSACTIGVDQIVPSLPTE